MRNGKVGYDYAVDKCLKNATISELLLEAVGVEAQGLKIYKWKKGIDRYCFIIKRY